MPKSRLIIAAILDLPSPLVALSTLPNLPLLLKSKMVAIAFAHPPKTPTLQALILKACFFSPNNGPSFARRHTSSYLREDPGHEVED